MEFIHIVTGGFMSGTVDRHSVPYLVLHNQHPDLLQLFPQILDVITDKAVCQLHIGSVIKYIQGTCHIDFEGCRHMLCLRLFLCQKCIV